MACVATWSFGINAVEVAQRLLNERRSCVDVIEKAINYVENEPSTGVYYVGRGSYPNVNGIVQLDAGIMRGEDHAIGAVCALEGYSCPISVARHIMDHCQHNIFVGDGAREYATKNGFVLESNISLLVPETKRAYEDYVTGDLAPDKAASHHDTLSLLCLDVDGHIAAGVSTSGPPFKFSGRIGDSPLPGCGYYADKVGAAAATGDGEKLMKFCPSFHVVQLMKQGHSPQYACEYVLKDISKEIQHHFEAGLIALDHKGNVGACGTVKKWKDVRSGEVYEGFPYAVWTKGNNAVIMTAPSF